MSTATLPVGLAPDTGAEVHTYLLSSDNLVAWDEAGRLEAVFSSPAQGFRWASNRVKDGHIVVFDEHCPDQHPADPAMQEGAFRSCTGKHATTLGRIGTRLFFALDGKVWSSRKGNKRATLFAEDYAAFVLVYGKQLVR